MNTSLSYFLIVAEEMNISRAAQKLFISHQSLSKHIRLLENEYGVQLFERSPRLPLTPAGKLLVNAALQIQQIETNLIEQFSLLAQETIQSVALGVAIGRYNILIPEIVPSFKRLYPNIEISVFSEHSIVLEKMLLDGNLDFYLGIRMSNLSDLMVVPLMKEQLFLMISDNQIQQYFPVTYPECISLFKKGVTLSHFQEIPFIFNPPTSPLTAVLQKYARHNSFSFKIVFESNNNEIHASMTQKDYGACIIPKMFLQSAAIKSVLDSEGVKVHSFPIIDPSLWLDFVLVCRSQKNLPAWQKDFIELMQKLATQW